MRRGDNPVFIHVGFDGLVLATEKDNRKQSAVLDLDPTTKLLAVNLCADYCAEHEWGIKDLQTAFGVKSGWGNYGIKKRKVTKIPKALVWVKLEDGREGFVYRSFWYSNSAKEEDTAAVAAKSVNQDSDLKPFSEIYDRAQQKSVKNPKRLACAWSERDFGCVSDDMSDIIMLKEIFKQFQKKNVIFTFSNALPAFENPGLIIAIADRLPKEVVKMLTDADKEFHEIEKFVVKSGIRELLKAKGKGYFALSPRRWDGGSIKFWLNPYDQDKNHYGYFTLEELRQWADDKGPIPMTPKQIIERHEERSGRKLTKVLQ